MRWTCIDKMAEWKSGECWTGVFNYKFFKEKYGMDACVDLMENSHKHSSQASLFGSVSNTCLPFSPLAKIGSEVVVLTLEEIVAKGVRIWENSLVGQIVIAKMPYVVI